MMEFSFRICCVEGNKNVRDKYLSRSVGKVAVGEDEENMQIIGQLFCKHDKTGLQMAEVTATVDSNFGLEESLEVIKNFLVSVDGRRTPVRLQRQAMKYQVNSRYICRQIETALRIISPVRKTHRIITACHDQISQWGISATTDFVARTFWWPRMRSDVITFLKSYRSCQLCDKEKNLS